MQEPQLSISGLHLPSNDFSGSPPGSLNTADNCVIDYKNVIGPRNGFEAVFNLPSAANRVVNFTDYQSNVVVRYADAIGRWNGTTFTAYSGTFSDPASDTKSRFVSAAKNLYVTTSVGVYSLDIVTGAWVLSGVPKALDLQITLSAVTGNPLADNTQTAYRIVYFIKDTNNNLKYGAPSAFTAIANAEGAARTATVVSTLPSTITSSYYYQLYRSAQTTTSAIVPVDQMKLVYEKQVTSTDVSNKYITIIDSQPEILRTYALPLYTGTDQEGILQANDTPPYCKDFCQYKDMVLYANCKSKQRLKLVVLGTQSGGGVQSGDVLTIAGTAYTGAGAENTATGAFRVYTTGAFAQDISDTVNSLIRVINRYSSNTLVYAYLLSGPTDLPGQILIEERGVGGSSFAVTASANGTAYSPALPTSGTTISSAQDTLKNGVYISKIGQPEAVPLTNLQYAGDASKNIIRIIALRDYVFILKEDGLFRLTGSTPESVEIAPFDLTVKLEGPDTAVTLANELWFLSSQGVVSVSDAGVRIRSTAVENVLLERLGQMLSTIRSTAFGISYESDRKYILCLPTTAGDSFCSEQYVFNYITNAWTRWDRVVSAGFVHSTEDKIYTSSGSSYTTSSERKTNTTADFVDESIAVTITASSGTSVTLSSVSGVTAGDVLSQSGNTSVITAVNTDTSVLTVQNTVTWTAAAATVLTAIDCTVFWKPLVGGKATFTRQYSEGLILFKRTQFYLLTMQFYSDVSRGIEEVTLTGVGRSAWGIDPWGNFPWGGTIRPGTLRYLIPTNKQYASQLNVGFNVRSGKSQWLCQGAAITFNEISGEVT